MKKKLLIASIILSIILLINGCIKERKKELIKNPISTAQNKPQTNYIIVPKATKNNPTQKNDTNNKIKNLYYKLGLNGKLQYKIFQMAMKGLEVLNPPEKKYLAIVDFTQDSSKNRFFMIDLIKETIIYNDLVAHGKNSGEKYAKYFSNDNNSHESSLGFYITGETYYGSNGYSLKLDGLDKNLNDNARKRAIVLHGAPYVNESVAKSSGRIGRSWGCPALDLQIYKDVINKLKGGNLLFQYAREYDSKTSVLKGIRF